MTEPGNILSSRDRNLPDLVRVEVFSVDILWLILISLLVSSCFVSAEVISAAMLAIVVFFLADPYAEERRQAFPGAGFFGIIVFVGLLGAAGKVPYDVAKDVWYVSNVVLTLLFGYLMIRRMRDLPRVLRVFVAAAAVVAVMHILQFVRNPSYLAESFTDIRSEVSGGYFITTLGVAITLGDIRFQLGLLQSKLISWTVIALCLVSVALSFSRTLWLVLMTVAVLMVFVTDIKRVMRIVCVVAVVAFFVITAMSSDRASTTAENDLTFVSKIVNSLKELTVTEYTSMDDINTYWRGFESYQALKTYTAGTASEHLFGKGFGTNVDLGFVMKLADTEFSSIPVLHNGYLYLLVKTGAVGLAAYLLYVVLTFRTGVQCSRRLDAEARFCGIMLVALALIILETTLVISGMFNKGGLFQTTLLIGMLMGHAESILQKG